MSEMPLLSDKLEKFLINLVTDFSMFVQYVYCLGEDTGFWEYSCVVLQVEEEEDAALYKSQIINVLQDIIEIIIQDVMLNGHA